MSEGSEVFRLDGQDPAKVKPVEAAAAYATTTLPKLLKPVGGIRTLAK
jgi:hypothetical protein